MLELYPARSQTKAKVDSDKTPIGSHRASAEKTQSAKGVATPGPSLQQVQYAKD